jgi:hypothetical protein
VTRTIADIVATRTPADIVAFVRAEVATQLKNFPPDVIRDGLALTSRISYDGDFEAYVEAIAAAVVPFVRAWAERVRAQRERATVLSLNFERVH